MKSLRSGVNLAPVTLKAGSTSELVLQSGWNLVSLAKQPGNSAPASVFSGAASRVFVYDACDAADHWKVWDPANPSGSDLTAVNPKLGLWAEAPAAVTLPVAGTEPASTTIHLCTGWNLIGAPFSQDRSVTGALSSIQGKYARVFGYDAADPADPWEVYDIGVPAWANTLQVLEPGKGYWVFATVETDLVLSNDTDGPIVQITTPADLSEVTTLTNVVGTVSGELIQEWHLAYRALGDVQWTTIGSGTTPVVNGVLGVFDPTLLLNGPYQLELTATDANNLEQSFRLDVAVEGQQKIGIFTLTFQDMEVPLSGLPIRILRTYDSRDKRQGDFGVGWTLDIRQGSYKNNRQPGEGWQFASGFLPCQFIRESLGHVTTIRLSDREIYRFKLSLSSGVPTLGGCFAQARFDFVDGPVRGATLTILGNTQVFYPNAGNEVQDAGSLEVYEPEAVRLTTRDGRTFDLDLQQGVTRLEDANGNELSITRDGITHSGGQAVTFERDGQGRIAEITDLEGKSLTYEYDTAGDLVSIMDRLGQTTHYTYSNHLLIEIQDARGITPIRNEYDANGRLLRNIDAFGKVIEYTHDQANNQEVITDRLGHSRLLEYDARGNVIREVNAEGKETRRTFDGQDHMLTETDPLGHVIQRTYDANGDLASFTDALGKRFSYTRDAQGRVLTDTDTAGKVTTYVYDSHGNLASMTDPLGAVTGFAYDNRGNLSVLTDPEGGVTAFEVDSHGNRLRETDPLGHETTFTYDRNGNKLTEVTARTTTAGVETLTRKYTYDAFGQLVQSEDPDGSKTSLFYDPFGHVTRSIDKLNRQTTYSYDEMGRLATITYPDTTTETFTYDAEGRRTSGKDRDGRITTFEYNSVGQVVKVIYPDNTFETSVYDAAGRLLTATDPRGNATRHEYDAAGHLTKVIDAQNHETVFAYDARGNRTATTDPEGNTTVHEYDDANRLTLVRFPGSSETRFQYDRTGRKVAETDPRGATARYGYDLAGRLLTVTDALAKVTRFGYDEMGNRTSQTDANNHVTTFEYDALGRMTKRILPSGSSESSTYNAAGNLASRTRSDGAVTTYAYDLSDRLLHRNYPDGTSNSFTYTGTGRRLTATDARGTTSYQYDPRGRLTSYSLPEGASLEFGYDAAGNRITSKTKSGAQTLTTSFTYDSLDRLENVTDPQGRIYHQTYDVRGNRTSISYPNGVTTAFSYDPLSRMVSLTSRTSVGAVLQSYAYSLDPAGNRARIEESDGTVRSYEYDLLNRLTVEDVSKAAAPVYRTSFDYDPVGNRLEQKTVTGAGTAVTPYTYDAQDRLLSAGSSTSAWDANGNLSESRGDQYAWDFENRLLQITKADGTVVHYTYDADGNRVRTETTAPGGVVERTDHLVDPTGALSQVAAEIDETGSFSAYYVRGYDLLAVIRPSGTRFFHQDGLGSVRALTNEAGVVTDTYSFTAFGELTSHTGEDPNAYLFAGEPRDPNSGFYYLRARWMDPASGRFVSRDPFHGEIEDPRSLNGYSYAYANPVNWTDPSGFLPGWLVPLILGSEVHRAIGVDFMAKGPNRWANYFQIATILGIPAKTCVPDELACRLKPDLADGEDGEVYEIKTQLYLTAGFLQLSGYIVTLNLNDPVPGRVWWYGMTYLPPPYLYIPNLGGWHVLVEPPVLGVILYEAFSNVEVLTVFSLVALILASEAANMARLEGEIANATLNAILGVP